MTTSMSHLSSSVLQGVDLTYVKRDRLDDLGGPAELASWPVVLQDGESTPIISPIKTYKNHDLVGVTHFVSINHR